jgi:hypothetical protein
VANDRDLASIAAELLLYELSKVLDQLFGPPGVDIEAGFDGLIANPPKPSA